MTSSPAPTTEDANGMLMNDINAELDKLTFGVAGTTKRPHRKGEPRFHTIVACVDASSASENVLAWAREIAKSHGARVVVASVHAPTLPGAGVGTMYALATGVEDAYRDAEARVRVHAEEATKRLRDAGVDTETVVTTGSIARALADVANAHRADLVILGSHGGGAISRVALGSVGNAILDRVAASVLIARGPPVTRKIVAATDGSASSFRAVAYALRQADLARADVSVVHVLEYPEGAEKLPPGGLLRDVIGRMELKHHPHISYRLEAGRPADRILAVAEEDDADLIVVGSRGIGNIFGVLVGSVSHKVVNAARASVLVVKDV